MSTLKKFFWLASCKKCSKAAIAIAWSITAFHKIKFPELYKLIQFFLSRQKNSATNLSKFSEILKRHLWKKSEKSFFWCKSLKIPLRENGAASFIRLFNYCSSSNVGSSIIFGTLKHFEHKFELFHAKPSNQYAPKMASLESSNLSCLENLTWSALQRALKSSVVYRKVKIVFKPRMNFWKYELPLVARTKSICHGWGSS